MSYFFPENVPNHLRPNFALSEERKIMKIKNSSQKSEPNHFGFPVKMFLVRTQTNKQTKTLEYQLNQSDTGEILCYCDHTKLACNVLFIITRRQVLESGSREIGGIKHLMNCECCPVSQLIVR